MAFANTDLGNLDNNIKPSVQDEVRRKLYVASLDLENLPVDLSETEKRVIRQKLGIISDLDLSEFDEKLNLDGQNLSDSLTEAQKSIIRERIGAAATQASLTEDLDAKADTDLQNIADDLVESEKQTIRERIGALSTSPSLNASAITGGQFGTNRFADDSVTLAKMASGTAGKYLGYDASGNPAELDAPSGSGEGSSTFTGLTDTPTAFTSNGGRLLRVNNAATAIEFFALTALDIPSLAASKITSGEFDAGRIPNLAASKISSGTFSSARIPSLSASKITSGTFNSDRIPSIDTDKITDRAVTLAKMATGTANTLIGYDASGNPAEISQSSGTFLGLTDTFSSYTANHFIRVNSAGNALTSALLTASDIPSLGASKIDSGIFGVARIPNLNASKITDGTFSNSRIPNLAASKITSGEFSSDRIPNLNASKINAGTFDAARIPNLNASKINAGTFGAARIPDLNADKITSGSFHVDRIPNLNTSKITAGTFGTTRIADDAVTLAKMASGTAGKFIGYDSSGNPAELDAPSSGGSSTFTGLTDTPATYTASRFVKSNSDGDALEFVVIAAADVPNLDASKITTGEFDAARIPSLNASKINAGTLADARIPSLNASKVNAGTFDAARIPDLDADKINTGTFDAARIPNLDTSKINTGTFDAARIPNLAASKITSGEFDSARIPNLAASKITSGEFADDRIPSLNASKINAGTFDAARIPNLDASKINAGTFDAARIPNLDASKINAGTFGTARLADDAVTLMKMASGTAGKFIGYDEDGNPAELDAPAGDGTTASTFTGLSDTPASYTGNASNFVRVNAAGNALELVALSVSDIPNLAASKINSGTFDAARIPDINASKITAGTIADARIPNFAASKITSGTFDSARIPNLNASKITAGTFGTDRITDDAITLAKMASGTAGKYIGYDASGNPAELDAPTSGSSTFIGLSDSPASYTASRFVKSNSGGDALEFVVLAVSDIPSLAASKITSGEFAAARIPNLDASKINAGTLADARIPSLAASKITSGTFDAARIPSLAASKITSGTFDAARIPDLNASKINAGTLADARIPSLSASKITSGEFATARIADDAITLAKLASGSAGKFIGYDESGNPAELDGISTFIGLTDTPDSFGTAGQTIKVNSAGDGIEFVSVPIGSTAYVMLEEIDRKGSSTSLPSNRNWVATGITIPDGVEIIYIDASEASDHFHVMDWTAVLARTPAVAGQESAVGEFETFIVDQIVSNVLVGQTVRIGRTTSNEILLASNGTALSLPHVYVETPKVPIGTGTVVADPSGSDGDTLERISIGGTNWNLPTGVELTDAALDITTPANEETDEAASRQAIAEALATRLASAGGIMTGTLRINRSGDNTAFEVQSHGTNNKPAFAIFTNSSGSRKAFQITNEGQSLAWASFEGNLGGVGPGLALGPGTGARDVELYRSAANTLRIPDTVHVNALNIEGGPSNTEIGYVDGVTSPIQTQLDGKQSSTGNIAASRINGALADANIPNLAASKITSGEFAAARIPNLNASKITAGTFGTARIADDAITLAKMASGTAGKYLGYDESGNPVELDAPTVGDTGSSTFTGLSDTPASFTGNGGRFVKVNSGASALEFVILAASDIPNLAASKITSGTLADARIPNLAASKITSGTLADARIPNLAASKITSGEFATARIPNLNASKINAGTFPTARIADNAITLGKMASGTAGRYVGYDTSGNPAELDVRTFLEEVSGESIGNFTVGSTTTADRIQFTSSTIVINSDDDSVSDIENGHVIRINRDILFEITSAPSSNGDVYTFTGEYQVGDENTLSSGETNNEFVFYRFDYEDFRILLYMMMQSMYVEV